MDRSEVSLRKRRRVERGSLMELSVPRARRAFSRKRFSLGEELKAYLGTPKRRFSMPWTYGRRKWDEVYNAILVETEEFQKDLDATLQLLQKRRRLNPNGNSVAHNQSTRFVRFMYKNNNIGEQAQKKNLTLLLSNTALIRIAAFLTEDVAIDYEEQLGGKYIVGARDRGQQSDS